MSSVSIVLNFRAHPCTNHSDEPWNISDVDCSCASCHCDDDGYCCGNEWPRHYQYCPSCGGEIEHDPCYSCNGETCGDCGDSISPDDDVTYTGRVEASWRNGELCDYRGYGHPHLNGVNSYCLDECAPLFENVTTQAQAIEAVVTHISNVNFPDGLGGNYSGIEKA